MVLAILYLQMNRVVNKWTPHTPESHWQYEILDRASDIAEYPGIGSHTWTMGGDSLRRMQVATAWFDAFTAVTKQHRKSYLARTSQFPYYRVRGIVNTEKLTKSVAEKLQNELDFVYEGLYLLQNEYKNEIIWITRPENREAVELAKLELRIIHLEKTLPAKLKHQRKVNMDLREVAYEDGK